MVVLRKYKTRGCIKLKIEFILLYGNAIWNITGHRVLLKILKSSLCKPYCCKNAKRSAIS